MEGKTQTRMKPHFRPEFPTIEADPVELSLGLSLNGHFGVDPTRHVGDRKRKQMQSLGKVAEERKRRTEMQRNAKIEDHNYNNTNNVLLKMLPSVCTEVGRRRIEGFLYRYRKGEEVKIVCVCHGSFLSPAEFVEHGGGGAGGGVLNPLKHIVVNPFPIL